MFAHILAQNLLCVFFASKQSYKCDPKLNLASIRLGAYLYRKPSPAMLSNHLILTQRTLLQVHEILVSLPEA